jgi:release factor glutamine methyltransferase
VAVAKAIPDAHVTLAEIDPLHLPTIQKNTALNLPVNRYIQVVESDLFSSLKSAEYFDFILTNPPYIDMAADTVDKNVINHEPHLALFGGVAGIEIIARIIHHAPHYLAPHGQLWIEHEPAQVDAITTLAHVNGFTCITHPDQYDTPRYSILTMAQ